MGIIQSVFCSVTFCLERVLTWTCCAVVLMLLMFTIILLMVYGISVGYHYAQKELASFSMTSRSTTEPTMLRSGADMPDQRPVVRLMAVNRTQVENTPEAPQLEVYQTQKPVKKIYMDTADTPIVVLETERPPKQPDLMPHERELARRLIGRFRRSKNETNPGASAGTSSVPFLRPLRNSTDPQPVLTTLLQQVTITIASAPP